MVYYDTKTFWIWPCVAMHQRERACKLLFPSQAHQTVESVEGLYEAKKALQYSIRNGTSQDGTCQFSESSDCKDDKKINILGRVASFFASILLENTYSTQRYAACISLISLIQFKCNWCWESEREGFLQNRNEQSWTSQTCKKLIESWSKLLWKGLETPSLASEFAKASVQSKLSNTLRWLPHSVTVNSDAISASNLHILKFDMLFCSTFSQPGQSWCGHWVLHLVALRSCWVFQAGPWPDATPLPRFGFEICSFRYELRKRPTLEAWRHGITHLHPKRLNFSNS